MFSCRNSWLRKKLVLWYKTTQGQKKPLETAGVIICNNSRCWMNNSIQSVNQLDSVDQSRLECYYRTSDDMNDGFGSLTASCREYTLRRAHQISVVKLPEKDLQRSDQFLKSRLSVILTIMESKLRCLQRLEITPMFGWSYPEAPVATWMSYNARIQNILKEFDSEQPTTQSGAQYSLSDDHTPIRELERHENRHDRESNGAIHWRLSVRS